MKKLTVYFLLCFLLSACGGGGGSESTPNIPEPEIPTDPVDPEEPTEPEEPVDPEEPVLTATILPRGKAIGTQAVLIDKLEGRKIERPEVDDGDQEEVPAIDPDLEFVGIDDQGVEFTLTVSYTNDQGQTVVVNDAVRPTGAMWLDAQTVYLEFFVRTENPAAIEAWQYLFQPETGKLILVQTLDQLSEAFETGMRKYVMPAHSPHNGLDYPVVYLKNTGWTRLIPNWEQETVQKTVLSTWIDTRGVLDGVSLILLAEDGTIYRLGQNGSKRSLFADKTVVTDITDHAIFWQENGRNYFYDEAVLYEIMGEELVKLADDARTMPPARRMTEVLLASEGFLYTIECGIHQLADSLFMTHLEPDSKIDGWVAGDRLVCIRTVRNGNPPPIGDRDINPLYVDGYCGYQQYWELYDVAMTDQATRPAVKLLGEPVAVVPLSDDEIYVQMAVCKAAGGDGVTTAKWSLQYVNAKVDLADQQVNKVAQRIAFSAIQ